MSSPQAMGAAPASRPPAAGPCGLRCCRTRTGGRPSPVGRTLLSASQQARLRVAGLRYPGDLLNLQHALPTRQGDLAR